MRSKPDVFGAVATHPAHRLAATGTPLRVALRHTGAGVRRQVSIGFDICRRSMSAPVLAAFHVIGAGCSRFGANTPMNLAFADGAHEHQVGVVDVDNMPAGPRAIPATWGGRTGHLTWSSPTAGHGVREGIHNARALKQHIKEYTAATKTRQAFRGFDYV